MWITTSPRLITMLLLFFHHTASLLLILAMVLHRSSGFHSSWTIKNEISVTTIDMILPCQNFSKSKTFNFLRKHCIIKMCGVFQKNIFYQLWLSGSWSSFSPVWIELQRVGMVSWLLLGKRKDPRDQERYYHIIAPGKSAKISSF